MTTRRGVLAVFGASALATSLSSFAQQQNKLWRIGFLSSQSRPVSFDPHPYGSFARGMRELGYVEGKNLVIEWRFANGEYERLPSLATELVRLKVDVIATAGTPATSAAQRATITIPIVMASIGDPVGAGLVKSLAHPGGNVTGLSNFAGDLGPKHLEMLVAIVPKLSRVVVLVNPTNPNHITILKNVQAAGQNRRVAILSLDARTPSEIDVAFSTMLREKAGAVLVAHDGFFVQQRFQIAQLAEKYRLPSIFLWRDYVEAGGLMSYGQNPDDSYKRAATYIDKIFKGAKPAELPVEQPMTLELVINGKTAKALGLTIPPSLMISANKVIE